MTEETTTERRWGPSDDAVDEETPLLASGPIAPATDRYNHPPPPETSKDDDEDDDEEDKPLPINQILLLCYARLVEPIAFFSIFPFVSEMVQKNGNLSRPDVGFYSGLIESLFSATQMCVMIFWGKMADSWGRKPVLVYSLFGVAITTAMFGFASSVWEMILYRCLAGVFAGTVVTVRTMISELSTKKTQARAFSLFALSPNVGIFLGPLLGGALADPAGQYGGKFVEIWFFRRFPYALPTLVTGSIGLSAAIVSQLFVQETKAPTTASNAAKQTNKPHSTMELLRAPGVLRVLYLYSHVMMLGFSFTAVVPLFYFTDPKHGGLGFPPFLISVFMAITGFSQAVWLLVVFPPLQNRIGTGGVMNICGAAHPLSWAAMPVLNLIVVHHNRNNTTDDISYGPLFWALGPAGIAIGVGVSMSFTAIQLALNDVSPSPETLGTLNGIALTLVSGIRAVSPWAFTSLYAFSANRPEILGGHMVWVVMVAIAGIYSVTVRWLPENARGIVKKKKHADEQANGGGSEERA